MKHVCRTSGFCLLIALSSILCSGPPKPPQNHLLPVPINSDQLKGEQRSFFDEYGAPDQSWQKPYGITAWVYCEKFEKPLLVEFDAQGDILTVLKNYKTKSCTKTRGIMRKK